MDCRWRGWRPTASLYRCSPLQLARRWERVLETQLCGCAPPAPVTTTFTSTSAAPRCRVALALDPPSPLSPLSSPLSSHPCAGGQDTDIRRFLKLFTMLPVPQIEDIVQAHDQYVTASCLRANPPKPLTSWRNKASRGAARTKGAG